MRDPAQHEEQLRRRVEPHGDGGFGNLIALPLQLAARQRGNTLFIDDRLSPFPDQWAFLAGIPRIAPPTVDALAEEGGRLGRIVGVPISVTGDDEGGVPWVIPSSRRPKVDPIVEPIPDEVRAVLSHRLFIEKRLAAFQNPEFYRRQKARLSTALTPRVIACAEDLPHHIALPRGCTEGLVELLRGLGADLRLEDSSECWQR